MNTIVMKLDELNPAGYNPRTITDKARTALKNSIKRFGVVIPILWNKTTGNIVGGHQRFFILKEMGITETSVIVCEMEEGEEKACNLALNANHLTGDFIAESTIGLLTEMEETDPELFDSLDFATLKESLPNISWTASPKLEDIVPTD